MADQLRTTGLTGWDLFEKASAMLDKPTSEAKEVLKLSKQAFAQIRDGVDGGFISAAQGQVLEKRLDSILQDTAEYLRHETQKAKPVFEATRFADLRNECEVIAARNRSRVTVPTPSNETGTLTPPNATRLATTPMPDEAGTFAKMLTRSQAAWNRMGWKGKTAVAVGVGAAMVGTTVATAYLVNRWRGGDEQDNAERLSHVQRHNYQQIATRLGNSRSLD